MSFITQLYYYVLLILYTKRKKKQEATKRKKKSNSKIGSKLPIVYIIVKSKKVDFEGNNIVHFDTEIKSLDKKVCVCLLKYVKVVQEKK